MDYLKFKYMNDLLHYLCSYPADETDIHRLRETGVFETTEDGNRWIYWQIPPGETVIGRNGRFNLLRYGGERITNATPLTGLKSTGKLKDYFRDAAPVKGTTGTNVPLPDRTLMQNMSDDVFRSIKKRLPDLRGAETAELVKHVLPAALETKDRLFKQYLLRIGKDHIHRELELLWNIGHSRIRGAYFKRENREQGEWLLLLDSLKTSLPRLAWQDTAIYYYLGGEDNLDIYLESGYMFPANWHRWWAGGHNTGTLLIDGANRRTSFDVTAADFKPVMHYGDLKFTGGGSAEQQAAVQRQTPLVPVTFRLQPYKPSESQRINRRLEVLTREINYLHQAHEALQPFLLSANRRQAAALKIFPEEDRQFREFVRDAPTQLLELTRYTFLRIENQGQRRGFHVILPNLPEIFGNKEGNPMADRDMGWCMGGTTLFTEPAWLKGGITVFVRGNLGIWPPLHLQMDESDAAVYTPMLLTDREKETVEVELKRNNKKWLSFAEEHLFVLWDGFEPAQRFSKHLQCIKIKRSDMLLMSDRAAIKRQNTGMLDIEFSHTPDFARAVEKSLESQRINAFSIAREKLAQETETYRDEIHKQWKNLHREIDNCNRLIKKIENQRNQLELESAQLTRRLSPKLREKISWLKSNQHVIKALQEIPGDKLERFIEKHIEEKKIEG